MGSKDKRRSRSPSSSDSSPERQRKEKKHKLKHKHKHKKHKKHDSDIDEEKLKAAKALLEQHIKQAAAGGSDAAAAAAAGAAAVASRDRTVRKSKQKAEKPAGSLPPGMPLLTADDYFERSAELTAWLQEIKHQYFNELTTQQTHGAFKEFVAAWNTGQLPLRFYQGLAAAPLKRTSYTWGFNAKAGSAAAGAGAAEAGKLGMAAFLQDQQEQRGESRAAARAGEVQERRSWRREQKELVDELLPKATGGTREARVEARLARREEARAREDSPDTIPVSGGGNMMGGDDSFQAARAREAKRQEWRSKQAAAKKEELAAKLSAAAQAEADKMAQFRALLAAQGGKIQIPKRQQ